MYVLNFSLYSESSSLLAYKELRSGKLLISLSLEDLDFLSLYQLPIEWVPGALSLGVKWLGPEADHSPPCSAKVRE
jgi:hypothetical protein